MTKRLLLPFTMLMSAYTASQQTRDVAPPTTESPYSIAVTVKEVQIRFHAIDSLNAPVTDLKPEEIDVFDDGKGPGTIVNMQQVRDLPLRVAFVLDTSSSTVSQLTRSREEARKIASVLLSREQDKGMVTTFDRSRHVEQTWTSNRDEVLNYFLPTARVSHDPIDGSSVYDTVFDTCAHDFSGSDAAYAANTLLLFSDGEDTASRTTLEAATVACRRSHTAVYAMQIGARPNKQSTGTAALRELTEQTGGILLIDDASASSTAKNVLGLLSELRSEYILYYRPSGLLRDGSFHRIVLAGPKRVTQITGMPGFYAPRP